MNVIYLIRRSSLHIYFVTGVLLSVMLSSGIWRLSRFGEGFFGPILRQLRMVHYHEVSGFEEFDKFVKSLPSGEPYYLMYTGSRNEEGVSWCPYCNYAMPVIEDALKKSSDNVHFVKVTVGVREYWKDRECPFRKDPRTKLVVLPTLVKWKAPQRLEGEQCSKPDLVEMLFQDDD